MWSMKWYKVSGAYCVWRAYRNGLGLIRVRELESKTLLSSFSSSYSCS